MTDWWLGAYGADMEGDSEGISRLTSRDDGSLALVELAATVASPTFLAARGNHLYAAAEGSGHVFSYRVHGATLVEDGQVASGGGWPCQLEFLDSAIVASNYEGGELGVVGIGPDGAVTTLLEVLSSTGSGPHPEQAGPHAHASFRLDETTLLSADLGADRILIHRIDGSSLTRTGELVLPPGTGPRDIARHRSGHILVLGEHGRDVHALRWTGDGLEVVARVGLPGAIDGDQAAALGFGPGGFVYAGLRGSNRVGVLHVSDDGLTLTPVGFVSCEGELATQSGCRW